MPDQNLNLPALNNTTPADTTATTSSTEPMTDLPTGGGGAVTTKEMMIGFGAVIIAGIIFILIKNYVSRMLVSSYKKSPRSADMAGWSLFCVLLFATIAGVLGILNASVFFTLPYLVPLGIGMLISIVMLIISLTSKR